MTASDIIALAFGAFFVFSGVFSLITKKALGADNARYTEESVKKYSLIYGLGDLIAGLFFIAATVMEIACKDDGLLVLKIVCWVLAAAALIIPLVLQKKYLVLKSDTDK